MWRYQKPTAKEAKKVEALSKAKLSDYVTDQDTVPINKKFDIEHILDKLCVVCYKNTAISLHDTLVWVIVAMKLPLTCPPLGIYYNNYDYIVDYKKQETLMRAYNIPSHKVYVETQWRYVLELMICHKESIQSYNKDMLPSISSDQDQEVYYDYYEPDCEEFISELARLCFGTPLTNPLDPTSPSTEPFPYYRYDWVLMLRIRGLPQFSNIIVIHYGPPIVERHWFERLQALNYEISFDLTKRHTSTAT